MHHLIWGKSMIYLCNMYLSKQNLILFIALSICLATIVIYKEIQYRLDEVRSVKIKEDDTFQVTSHKVVKEVSYKTKIKRLNKWLIKNGYDPLE